MEAKPLPVLQFSLGTLVLAGLIIGLIQVRPILSDGAKRLVLLVNPPSATATAIATLTATPTPTPFSTPRPSPTDTLTVSPTATGTSTPTQTPTFEPTEAAAVVPGATDTPTTTPTPTPLYGKPVLFGPESGKLFGRDDEVLLRWGDMGPLGPNETYAVRMTWLQNGRLSFGGHNLKQNFWIVPPEQYWGLADELTGRQYEWVVFVEAITTDENGKQVSRPISDTSDRRVFLWQ